MSEEVSLDSSTIRKMRVMQQDVESESKMMHASGFSSESYDVFLSFRGPDTRKGFADFLYEGLAVAGISVFRDEEELPVGEPIHPNLLQAINQSKISIPVLSRDYASSKSCLMEVEQMLECRRTSPSHIILPVFYDVEPSTIKDQIGTFEKSFCEHGRNGTDLVTIEMWKDALREIGHLKGWDLANIHCGYQSKAVSIIVSHVVKILKKAELVLPENLVGLESHVREIMKKLDVASQDVRIVGIHGIGGVGKTTLAKLVYNQVHHHFDACSFIENIREVSRERGGFRRLQKQLVSNLLKKRFNKFDSLDDGVRFMRHRFCNMKVLILLDDLDDREQLAFLGEPDQFGPGSRILITTRKGDILQAVEKYQVECMNRGEALRLFCKHAFQRDSPERVYHHITEEIISIVGGLPLALEVTGSCLFGKGKEFWEDMKVKLKLKPDAKVKEKLMISYEYLDQWQKEIFLDIACLFIGNHHRTAFYMWEDCKFLPSSGIETLILLSLVKIGENCQLEMHDQLRDLGREIVREQNPRKPGKRSRLWNHEDAVSTLRKRKGTPKVEALSLAFDGNPASCFSCEDFEGLSNLRFLKLDQANIGGDFENGLSTLSWLDWEGCSRIDDLLNLHSDNLVILNLSRSQITQEVNSWSSMMKRVKKLKVLDLGGCENLSGCIQFPEALPLKVLNLERCSQLRQLGTSISNLKDLESLNLKFCTEIASLPRDLGFMKCLQELLIDETSIRKIHFPEASLEQLKTLSARGCRRLKEITDSIGSLKSLMHLALDDAIIEKLPRSIGSLTNLESLSVRNCKNLLELPDSVGNLKSLTSIDLSYTSIDELPTSFRNLDSLKVLKMERCFLREFPDVIADFGKLEEINFSSCRSLNGKISRDFSTALTTLRLSHTEISSLPTTIGALSSRLQDLDLVGCRKLLALPNLPSSLVTLRAGSKELEILPDLSNLVYLKELHLHVSGKGDNAELSPHFEWISSLSALEILDLTFSERFVLRLPRDFVDHSQLRKLNLSFIDLQHLPQLPSSLSRLSLQNCRSSSTSPDLSNLHGLLELEVNQCEIAKVYGIHHLEALRVLKVTYSSVQTLDGLEQLHHLRVLTVSHCTSLASLPDLSNLRKLQEKDVEFWNR